MTESGSALSWMREPSAEATPRDEVMRKAADATRFLIDRLHATEAPSEALEGLATAIAGLGQLLDGYPDRREYDGFAETASAGESNANFAYSPVVGAANPLAPPLKIEVDGEIVRGVVSFGHAYEGLPGHVHGGFLSAAFEDLLGMVTAGLGKPAFLGTHTVRFRTPTPLHTELRMIGEIDSIEGRKIFASGRMYDGDRLTAEADAVLVIVEPERLTDLMQARERLDRSAAD